MTLDFGAPGNGPEVLWAGMFTIAAVVGSVLLALWSQRRDFDRRESEMKSAFEAQEATEWAGWRRHMAERGMGVLTKVAQAGLEFHNHGKPYLETHQEVDEIHSLLHLDPHPSGTIIGDWISTTCREMNQMRPLQSQADANLLTSTAGHARAKVMAWALDPSATMSDQELLASARASHGGHAAD